MKTSTLLITYPELSAVALANVLDVVPVDLDFDVQCGGITRISTTLDAENEILMKVNVNGGQNKNFLKTQHEKHNCISKFFTVVQKVNFLLDGFPWCCIEYIWTPCGFRYEIHDFRSNYVFCIKQDSKKVQNFIVLNSKNETKYEINVQNFIMQITTIEGANNYVNNEQILTEKLLLVCAAVLINKREIKKRICYCNFNDADTTKSICSCDVNCSLQKQTIIICIVLCLLVCVCVISFSSWGWNYKK